MDKPKTKVVKSKSSNSAITTKSEPRQSNKKCRSNAEFQPLALKKRGVYVEKKPTKMSIRERDMSPVVLKKTSLHRPIPRVGRKRFLASVLTILSQSTTGTQHPDTNGPDRQRKFDRNKIKLKKKRDEEIIHENTISSAYNPKKKQRYRSKVLNDMNNEMEKLVVLRSKKEIAQTPSNYSQKSNKEPETIKWADILPPLVKNCNLENVTVPEEDSKDIEKKNKNTKIITAEKDPSTLIAEMPKKDEKKLYNFFVDLLETTFNVYNVKTEFNPHVPDSSVASSKTALEMDESVAKKLNIQKVKDSPEVFDDRCSQSQSSKHYYCIKPDENGAWDDQQLLDHFQPKSSKRSRTASPSKSLKRKRKLQSESFDYKKVKPIPLTNSSPVPKKSLLKNRKKDFINSLKEQLKMEENAFVEPQNFFQALKLIARNKRRCQKSIHFNESTKKSSEGDVHVCQFRRRRLLSASTKSSGKKSSYHPESDVIRSMRSFTRNSDITSSTFKKLNTITITETSENEIEPSQHSLEVYGFDYETNACKKGSSQKTDTPGLNSTGSLSEDDYNMNEALLKYSDSGSSSMIMGSRSHVATKHGLRPINKLLE